MFLSCGNLTSKSLEMVVMDVPKVEEIPKKPKPKQKRPVEEEEQETPSKKIKTFSASEFRQSLKSSSKLDSK